MAISGVLGVPASARPAADAGTGEGDADEAGAAETDDADETDAAIRLPTSQRELLATWLRFNSIPLAPGQAQGLIDYFTPVASGYHSNGRDGPD